MDTSIIKLLKRRPKLFMWLTYRFYKIKNIFRIKTLGYSETKSLILTKIMETTPIKKIGFIQLDNMVSDKYLDIEYKNLWADPESMISIIFSIHDRQARIIIGDQRDEIISKTDIENILKETNRLISGNQFIKGLEYAIKELAKRKK